MVCYHRLVMKRSYISLDEYLKNRFGEKVYKIALDGGMTCPNRDGTKGFGGCIFCSSGGSGEFAVKAVSDGRARPEAIDEAIARLTAHGKKTGSRYIAYFQSYTNTYAPADYLRELFSSAISDERIVALSIGTRPDCLPLDVLELLGELNRQKPVWVELGLQTIHEHTAEIIRRGYPLSDFDRAVHELRSRGIEVIVHVILGLPGESTGDMLETVRYLNQKDIQGVKFQQLYVLEGTDLAYMYRNDPDSLHILSLEEYMDILEQVIGELREDIVVHRLTGDGPKNILLAPDWSRDKKNVLNTLKRHFTG